MKIIGRIIRLALRHKWRLASAYVCLVGATVAYLTLPKLFGHAIDEIATSTGQDNISESGIFKIIVLILIMGTIKGVLGFGQSYLGESLGHAVAYDIRNHFYNHVQRLSFGFHDKHHTGNLMSRAITDVEAIRMFVNTGIINTPYHILTFVLISIIILNLNWQLGMMAIIFLPPLSLMISLVRLKLRAIWLRVQENMGELSTILQENLTGTRIVKAFGSEKFETSKFSHKNADLSNEMIKASKLQALNSSSMLLILMISIGIILWYGGTQVISGQITAGELAQFLFYMQVMSLNIRAAGPIVGSLARATSAGQRLFEILDYTSPVKESPNAFHLPRLAGHVKFENVYFGYHKNTNVLENICIDAKPGQIIALLGQIGSGKSSLVHLLPRFYNVSSGHITIDGIDINKASLSSLRQNISLVQQDVFLFSSSIKDNIAYGRKDVSFDEIVNVAKLAQLHDEILEMENGYDTLLGERGSNLSGGQRQRMAIARSILMDTPIIILDDSTSSVDANTEKLIRKATESLIKGKTTFVISHRISTLQKADQIIVLDKGYIVETGSHSDLISFNGHYRNIYDLQLRPQEEVMLEFESPSKIAG